MSRNEPEKLKVAVCQLTSGEDAATNLAQMLRLVDEAALMGASLALFPENALLMAGAQARRDQAQPLNGPWMTALSAKAHKRRCAILVGGLPERSPDPMRPYNTAVLVDERGNQLAAYRKRHLFSLDLPPEPPLDEGASTLAGDALVTATVGGFVLGLSICYDLRFPEHYRALSTQGAEVLLVPAAFTVPTGRAHWEVLLRARAIENLAYVLAPAQVGRHPSGRETYGHSLAVDPWGQVLGVLTEGPGLLLVELTKEALLGHRRHLPALAHRRDFTR